MQLQKAVKEKLVKFVLLGKLLHTPSQSLVLMKRKLTNLLKQSLRRLFAPFGTSGPERVLHAEKGRGRAFDIPFSRIPRGMCGQIEKSSFPAYAAGHPLS